MPEITTLDELSEYLEIRDKEIINSHFCMTGYLEEGLVEDCQTCKSFNLTTENFKSSRNELREAQREIILTREQNLWVTRVVE